MVDPTRRIPTLDGWRALAILAVIVHHATASLYTNEADYWKSATRYGAFGVDIFFALSGLLITKLLLEEFRDTGSISLRRFYIRRAFRILPPYVMVLVVVTIAGLWRSLQELAGCLFLFRNYVPDELVGRATAHLWSLAVEEHFYLLWPGVLVLCHVRKGKTVAPWLALSFGLWRIVESQWNLVARVPPHFRTDLRLDALLWGCVVAFLLDEPLALERFRRQTTFWSWAIMVSIALVSIRYYSLLTSVLVAVLIPIALGGTVVHAEWWISRILDWPPMRWIGRISYSLYLWQQLFLIPAWENPAHAWQRWPYNIAATLLVAAGSYYLIEKPFLRLGRKLAAAPSDARGGSATPVVLSETV